MTRSRRRIPVRRLSIQISADTYRLIEDELAAACVSLSVSKMAASIVEAWCLRLERERRKPKAEDYCEARGPAVSHMPAQPRPTGIRGGDQHND